MPGSGNKRSRTITVPDHLPGKQKAPPTVKDQAKTWIQARLWDGTFEPGSIISATAIAPSLGVSRTPVREAMEALAVEGYIKFVGVSGAVVLRVQREDILDILAVEYAIVNFVAQKLRRECAARPLPLERLQDVIDRVKKISPDASGWDVYALTIEFIQTMCDLAQVMPMTLARVTSLKGKFRLVSSKCLLSATTMVEDYELLAKTIGDFTNGPDEEQASEANVRQAVQRYLLHIAAAWAPTVESSLREMWNT